MNITDYDYALPEDRIAIRPPKERGSTRLLVLDKRTGNIKDSFYKDLDIFLRPGDLLILNKSKVIKARLIAENEVGKKQELLLLEKHNNSENQFEVKVMYRGKLVEHQELKVGSTHLQVLKVNHDGTAVLKSQVNLLNLADKYGTVPLPPYMHRAADEEDSKRYQTIFAENPGSVAAPTASLNFTNALFEKLSEKDIHTAEITLHVGLGTFLPIREQSVEKHKMHNEYYEIPAETIEAIRTTRKTGNKVIAVGTTVTRTLEHCCSEILSKNPVADISGETEIFIYPGYEFKIVDSMLTNFHAPRSTVLMMAAAFAGWENLRNSYQHAVSHDYNFLSYGDSMLIF